MKQRARSGVAAVKRARPATRIEPPGERSLPVDPSKLAARAGTRET